MAAAAGLLSPRHRVGMSKFDGSFGILTAKLPLVSKFSGGGWLLRAGLVNRRYALGGREHCPPHL